MGRLVLGRALGLWLPVAVLGCSNLPRSDERAEQAGSVALSLVSDPTVGKEIALDPPATLSSSYFGSTLVRGASSYLFLWQHDVSSLDHVYGIRYGLDGTRLDAGAIPIGVSGAFQNSPKGCFNGTDWVVMWMDQRNGQDDPYVARVADDGTVKDAQGTAVDIGTPGAIAGSIACDGKGNALVTWSRGASTRGAFMDAAGDVSASFEVEANKSFDTDVAFNGTNFLVVNVARPAGTYLTRARRISPAGAVLDAAVLSIFSSASSSLASAVSDGTDFIVGYSNATASAYRIVKADGSLDASGSLVGSNTTISMAYGNGAYLVAQPSATGYALSRISSAGVSLGQKTVSSGYGAVDLSVAFGATDHLLVYGEPSAPAPHPALGTRLDAGMQPLDDPRIVMNDVANHQQTPRAAFNGQSYLIVWEDQRDLAHGKDIYGVRMSPTGQVLDANSFLIATGAKPQVHPSVASNGSDFLVVWEDDGDVSPGKYLPMMTRVSAAGQVLDASGVAVDQGFNYAREPRVASDGTNYYVIWRAAQSLVGPYVLQGRRVLADTTKVDAAVQVSDANVPADSLQDHALAYNGSNYLAVWADLAHAIKVTRIAPADGSVLDTPRVTLASTTSNKGPGVASDGTNWLVVWSGTATGTDYQVWGTRVGPSGTVLDKPSLVVAPDSGALLSNARTAFDGSQFWVAWQRSDSPNPIVHDYSLVAQKVSPLGTVSAGEQISISAQPLFDSTADPVLTPGAKGNLLLTYTRLPVETTIAETRAYARLIGEAAGAGGVGGDGGAGGEVGDGMSAAGTPSGGESSGGTAGTAPGGTGGGPPGGAGAAAGGTGGAANAAAGTSNAGNGGSASRGGTPPTSAGAPEADAGESGAAAPVSGTASDGGCGCRTSPAGDSRFAAFAALGALTWLQRRRRRSGESV